MDQNNLIAELIPQYQKFLSDTIATEEKAAEKLRPQQEEKAEEMSEIDEESEAKKQEETRTEAELKNDLSEPILETEPEPNGE